MSIALKLEELHRIVKEASEAYVGGGSFEEAQRARSLAVSRTLRAIHLPLWARSWEELTGIITPSPQER